MPRALPCTLSVPTPQAVASGGTIDEGYKKLIHTDHVDSWLVALKDREALAHGVIQCYQDPETSPGVSAVSPTRRP
ncbi:hypothetical protein OPT61_g9770 [Boeremia exigua]|uniref:Uncharacterized protein n=1 Tax=Boeremia exigua TaxID=749465 RepID=A0ACC2HSN6_9PLEO|nr:hypothetical protein OPT61_g9770 [Boeremia exigua]